MCGTSSKNRGILAVAFYLASGCSGGAGGGGDMGQGGGDLGGDGGGSGGDMAQSGPPGLAVLAGQLGGAGSADRTGTAARFGAVYGLTFDGAGSLFIADNLNGPVRKLDTATGAVTTTMSGSAAPYGVAWDGAGSIYFSETSFPKIRKYEIATGLTTTVAGSGISGSADGTGAAASFNSPGGLTWDGAGNLYVADTLNHTIRKIVAATGVVTTLAGTAGASGSTDGTSAMARFNRPTDVQTDGAGNLYVADSGNQTIRKIVAATGAVMTFAGTAGMSGASDGTGVAARFTTPRGIGWSAGSLYVTDNTVIRRIVTTTAAVTTVAGTAGVVGSVDGTGAAASFLNPLDVEPDGAGNLYVADVNTVRKVEMATGVVTTFAGLAAHAGNMDGAGAMALFNAPDGLAADGAGTLFVAEAGNRVIRQINVATGQVMTLGSIGAGRLGTGRVGLAWDGAGNLYVADSGHSVIRQVVVATAAMTILAGTNGSSGSSDGTGTAARFSAPLGVAADRSGSVYVVDSNNHTIRQIVVASGAVTTLAGTAGTSGSSDGTGAAARFNFPQDVVADGAGNLYVADSGNCSIRQIVASTGAVTTLVGTAGQCTPTDGTGTAAHFGGPQGLALDGTRGFLYVSDGARAASGSYTVRKLVLATKEVITVAGTAASQRGVLPGPLPGGLNLPFRLAVAPNQGLLISDWAENVVLIARGL